MRLWLTRQSNGQYMLTATKPPVFAVRGFGTMDAYVRYGDPIGLRNLCPDGVRAIFGIELKPLQSVRLQLGQVVVDRDSLQSFKAGIATETETAPESTGSWTSWRQGCGLIRPSALWRLQRYWKRSVSAFRPEIGGKFRFLHRMVRENGSSLPSTEWRLLSV